MRGGRRPRAAVWPPFVAAVLLLLTSCAAHSPGGTAPTRISSGSPVASSPGPVTIARNPWLDRRVVAVTHNGGQLEFPQDTLFALHSSQALHVQVVDVDVQLSKDGVPVLIHSETLDSSTSGHGRVSDSTADQLGHLDAAFYWKPGCGTCAGQPAGNYPDRGIRSGAKPLPSGASSRGEFGVPTLRQVFQQFPLTYLDIELKPESNAGPAVAELIHQFHRESRTVVACFDDAQITAFHRLAPAVATSPGQTASTGFFLGTPVPAGYQILQLPYRYTLAGKAVTVITPDLVERAHAADLAVWVWDDDAAAGAPLYRRLVELGVDGILASAPSTLLSVLRSDHEEWTGRS